MTIAVVGNGFAATQCVMSLRQQLPESVEIVYVRTKKTVHSDILYGSISSPSAYQFNLQMGINEPELLLNTNTSFSFGSRYVDWGKSKLDWMQCFHLPFHAEAGVFLHHYMTRHNLDISDYLISVQAAKRGRFAHPPQDKPQSALARAEYGYHFDSQQWTTLFNQKLNKQNIRIVNEDIANVNIEQGNIKSISTFSNLQINANMYIDCTGSEAVLLSKLEGNIEHKRSVDAKLTSVNNEQTGPAYRQVTGFNNGWQSLTPLRQCNMMLRLRDLPNTDVVDQQQTFHLGKRPRAWSGNCVGIGHAAYIIEPLTPAPYMLLIKDINRLLELVPLADNHVMERNEYNLRLQDDIEHTQLFHDAMYLEQSGISSCNNVKLERKITQFCHRGVIASYDLEPFNDEDWVILHWGMGRIPSYYDKLTEQVPVSEMSAKLAKMKQGIAHLASQMPPHGVYLQNFLNYLKDKYVSK